MRLSGEGEKETTLKETLLLFMCQVGPPPETKLGGTTNNWGKKTVLKETLLLFMSQVDAEPVWSSRKGKETNTAPPASPPRSASKKAKKSPKKKVGLKTETMSPVPSVGFSSSAKTPVSATPSPLVPNNQTEQKMEVWFHESCLVWAPGVCLVPPRIAGLDEAIADSQQVVNLPFCRTFDRVTVFCALGFAWELDLCVASAFKVRKNIFLKITNLNLILQIFQSGITRSEIKNFLLLKLMLAGKPTILNKMAHL